jgi:hypothetical protein
MGGNTSVGAVGVVILSINLGLKEADLFDLADTL